MIELRNVSKDYGEGKVLEGISFRIDPREFVCITGPSGAGKSTLLSLLVGAESVSRGSITVDSVDLRTVPAGALQIFRRRVGIVFQDWKLLSNRTVEENVSFPLEVCGATDEAIAKRVPDLLKQMGLLGRRKALPRELSGGEKARTAIARAIAHSPLILLADEPTQNLDPDQACEVLQIFRDINADGTTVIVATHDAVLVDLLNTRVIRLDGGRVIRDSVGGYKHRTKTEVTPDFNRREEVAADFNRREEKKPHHASHRKVRVTAIHSA